MPDEEINPDQGSEQSSSPPKSITEGHQPEPLLKGHQPIPFGDIFTGGHKPDISNLNPLNAPQGGSGVPPVESSGESGGDSDRSDAQSGGSSDE